MQTYHHCQSHMAEEMGSGVNAVEGAGIVAVVEGSGDVGRTGLRAEHVRDLTVDTSRLRLEPRSDVHREVVEGPVGYAAPLGTAAAAEPGHGVEDDTDRELASITDLIPVTAAKMLANAIQRAERDISYGITPLNPHSRNRNSNVFR
jgi:hypothetical protein